MANLEKEAKAAGCWKEAHSGTQAAVTLARGSQTEKLKVTSSTRHTSAASTDSKVIGLPGISGPLHMLFTLPGTSSTPPVCLVNSYSCLKTQFGYVPPLESYVCCSFSMSPLPGP